MMNSFVPPSTFLLTLLLMVGLFFFVKASVKDRTQQVRLVAEQPQDATTNQLKQYFDQRAYQVTAVDQDTVAFEGLVRPSVFLAVFLGLLVAVSMLCLALVLLVLLPQLGAVSFLLLLLSPLASWFYWQQAERPEQVLLKVEPFNSSPDNSQALVDQSLVTVTGHRDELIELKRTLQLRDIEILHDTTS